jgi:hypothetical protein
MQLSTERHCKKKLKQELPNQTEKQPHKEDAPPQASTCSLSLRWVFITARHMQVSYGAQLGYQQVNKTLDGSVYRMQLQQSRAGKSASRLNPAQSRRRAP